VEGGETPQSPANHQRARTPPETQRSTGRRGRDRNVRSANPSPEQEVNQPQNLRNTTSLKREKSDSKPSDLRRSKRKRKGERKTRVELGNTVVGFISIATRGDTDEVARHIYDLPVPPQVSRRLILYGDVCFCGSSAAVEINLEGPNVGTDDLGGDGTDSSRGGFVGSVAGPAGSSTAVSTAGSLTQTGPWLIDSTVRSGLVGSANAAASSFFPPCSTRTMSIRTRGRWR
jgi:hypothetical protein